MQVIMEHLDPAGTISLVVYLLVFLGGVASAVSPCFMPVLAMFGGYVGGYATTRERAPMRLAALFTAGQAITLAIAGVAAVLVGRSILALFTEYHLDRYIPAAIGIVMGLHLLGVIRLHLPLIGRFRARRPTTSWDALLLGLPFGLVVTPCTIPIFITIVTYLALHASPLHGVLLMLAYALGRGVILFVVAYWAGTIKDLKLGRWNQSIARVSGAGILLVSVYLLFFAEYVTRQMPTI